MAADETGIRAGRDFYAYLLGSAEAPIEARDARLFERLKVSKRCEDR